MKKELNVPSWANNAHEDYVARTHARTVKVWSICSNIFGATMLILFLAIMGIIEGWGC